MNVPIREDNIDEENEDFTLRLITTQDDVILNPDSTRVVINDDDGTLLYNSVHTYSSSVISGMHAHS